MKLCFAAALLACFPGPAFAQSPLSPSDETAAFTAAGFRLRDGQWKACEDDVSASYIPGWIEAVTDLNGDDQPEALVSEGTTFCYGFVGTSYAIVSRQPDGGWSYAVYVFGVVALPLLGTKDWQGTGRYMLAAWPVFAALAMWMVETDRRRLRAVVLVVSGVALVFLTSGYARGYYLA